MAETLWVCNAGTIDYRSALELQEALRLARQQDQIPDTMLLLEHAPAVYTRGRRSVPAELTMGEAWYAEQGIEIIQTRRGGKVTYHGPGQLVGYGIFRVDDVLAYVRKLENAMVAGLAREGLQTRSRPQDGPNYTGVWLEDRKIASIGVHLSLGVTAHGFAVNVENDMRPFNWVIACGLPEVTMTSIAAELDEPSDGAGGATAAGIPASPGMLPAHLGTVPITASDATNADRYVRFRAEMAAALADEFARDAELVELEQLRQIADPFLVTPV